MAVPPAAHGCREMADRFAGRPRVSGQNPVVDAPVSHRRARTAGLDTGPGRAGGAWHRPASSSARAGGVRPASSAGAACGAGRREVLSGPCSPAARSTGPPRTLTGVLLPVVAPVQGRGVPLHRSVLGACCRGHVPGDSPHRPGPALRLFSPGGASTDPGGPTRVGRLALSRLDCPLIRLLRSHRTAEGEHAIRIHRLQPIPAGGYQESRHKCSKGVPPRERT